MFIPRNRIECILNFVNHGQTDEKKPGFVREGEVFDGDSNKPTYFYNGLPHNGTDIALAIGTPIWAWKYGLILKDVFENETGGITAQVYDPETDRLFGFTHLLDVPDKTVRKLRMGEIFAYSGNSGSLCGYPHIHFTIYKGQLPSFKNLLDPLMLPEFQDLYSFIPYPYRTGTPTKQWLHFVSKYHLYINGNFEHINRLGERVTLKFHSNKRLEGIYHTGKIIVEGKNKIKEFYKTEIEITDLLTQEGKSYCWEFNQYAYPGVYYFQGKTPSGWTVPARILVI